MIEIIYRIYEIPTETKQTEIIKAFDNGTMYHNYDALDKIAITMDILICENRDRFKEIIKSMYGNDCTFSRPRKPKGGEVYCIIIAEHAYQESIDRLFSKKEYTCDFCGTTVTRYGYENNKLSNSEIKYTLLGQDDKYANLNFCTPRCQSKFKEQEKENFTDDQNTQGLWVTKDSFSMEHTGYIYKITKKSTNEFYIGQTIYAPVFRWGQHLKTGRFKINDITDYIFETLEIVPKGINILDRESFYIQSFYQSNPKLCLNEINIKNTNGLQQKTEANNV